MVTITLKLSQVKINDSNPREIETADFQKLVDSLLVFPHMLDIRPVVVDDMYTALGGNMRTQALNYISTLKVEAIADRLLENRDFNKLQSDEAQTLLNYWAAWLDDPVVSVILADSLTASQREQFIIKDNSNYGSWNFDALANMFDEKDLDAWGVDVWQMTNNDATAETSDVADDDNDAGTDDRPTVESVTEDNFDANNEQVEPRAKAGDIYKLGDHLVMCGDSTDENNIIKLMGDDRADLVFTDPPYGMGKEKDGVSNDNLYRDALLDFNKKWIPLAFKYMKDVGSFYCWGLEEPLMRIYCFILLPMIERQEIVFRNEIVWHKGHGQNEGLDTCRMYPRTTERCLFLMKGVQGFINNADQFYEPFEVLRAWLVAERDKMGWTAQDVVKILGRTTATHYFSRSQWAFPHREAYEALQRAAQGKAFERSYDDARQEYERLKEGDDARQECWRNTRAYFNNTHEIMNDVWEYKSNPFGETRNEFLQEIADAGGHATPKPLKLCARGIISSSRENDIVLDMFGGSGSTLIACEKTKRRCRTIELDPHYVDVIITRWERLTGGKAEKIN